MSFKLIILENATLEIKDAFSWYEAQKEGLGYEFLEEIENCYLKLEEHPNNYSYISTNHRRVTLKRFPYIIIFTVIKHEVIISKIIHMKRFSK